MSFLWVCLFFSRLIKLLVFGSTLYLYFVGLHETSEPGMPCKWRQPHFHLFSIKEIESRHFIQELNCIILRHKTAGKRLDVVGTYLNKFAELFLAARLKKAMDWCWSFAVFFSLSVNQKANLVRLGVWTNFTLEFFADFNFFVLRPRSPEPRIYTKMISQTDLHCSFES